MAKKIKKFNELVNSNNAIIIIDLMEKAKSSNSSDLEKISQREPYKKIVEMGDEAIPYLLKDMDLIWYRALSRITGVETVGNTSKEVINFWKKWAKENGY